MPELADITDRLTNKVGPLPAWAWAAIPAAGYVAWSYYKASRGEGVISDVESAGGALGSEAEDYGINTDGAFLPGYGSAPAGSSNLPVVETPKFDNQSWFRQASNWLIGEGIISSDVVSALNAYIYGNPEEINQSQMNALQRALMKFGAAPEPAFVPKISGTATPTYDNTPAPVTNVNVSYITGESAWINWSPSERATRYTVIVYHGQAYVTGQETRATSVTANGLKPSHTYSVFVWAGNEESARTGWGGWSTPVISTFYTHPAK